MADISTETHEYGEHPRQTINKHRIAEANSIITKYAAFAFGGGVIPFPMMDIAAVSGIQVKMLADIAKLYEVEFVENWGKSTLSSLIGGALPHILAVGTVGSLIKAIPVLGSAVGFATVPLLSAATTYAVGKVFVQHFESGGTFLDFDAETAKAVFRDQFSKGKELYKSQTAKLLKRNQTVEVEVEAAPAVVEDAEIVEAAPVMPVVADAVAVAEDEITMAEVPVRRRRTKSSSAASSV